MKTVVYRIPYSFCHIIMIKFSVRVCTINTWKKLLDPVPTNTLWHLGQIFLEEKKKINK